ncbi:MAG: F0F1 ATP synthase subunit C [Candidatus Poseidoniales archaeon]|jgi:V/A-type H+-transporting ATPase subunit K
MNVRNTRMSARILIVLMGIILIGQTVTAVEGEAADNASTEQAYKNLGAGLALGLAAIGAGISQSGIGSAAVGMLAEDESKFGAALIFTALPESLVILGMMPLFL